MRSIIECGADDVVEHPGGNKYLVLGRLGPLLFLSESYDHKLAHYRPFTIDELIKEKWKLLTKDGRTPMTRKELENESFIKIIDE